MCPLGQHVGMGADLSFHCPLSSTGNRRRCLPWQLALQGRHFTGQLLCLTESSQPLKPNPQQYKYFQFPLH